MSSPYNETVQLLISARTGDGHAHARLFVHLQQETVGIELGSYGYSESDQNSGNGGVHTAGQHGQPEQYAHQRIR